MASLRQLENKTGITRDITNLQKLYAEDWNEMKAKINDGADEINTLRLKINGQEAIGDTRNATFSSIQITTGAKTKLIKKGNLTYQDTTFKTIETLASDDVLFNIYVNVITAFNGTTPVLNIGTATNNSKYANNIDISTTGWKTLTLTNIPDKPGEAIGGIISGTGMTQGELEVYFEYAKF